MDEKSSDDQLERAVELLSNEHTAGDMLEALVRVGLVIVNRLLWIAQGQRLIADEIEGVKE